MKVVDLTLGEFRQHVEPSEALELARKVIGEIPEEVLGPGARLLGDRSRLDRLALGAVGTLTADVSEHRSDDRPNREHGANACDLACPHGRAMRRELTRLLVREQLLGGFALLENVTLVAAGLDDTAEHVVRELDAADIEPLLDTQQASVHEDGKRVGRGTGLGKAADQTFLGYILAKTGIGEQVVLDDAPDGGRLIGERALVEVLQNRGMRAGEEVQGDLAAALRDARIVQLAADETEE